MKSSKSKEPRNCATSQQLTTPLTDQGSLPCNPTGINDPATASPPKGNGARRIERHAIILPQSTLIPQALKSRDDPNIHAPA
ncbi:MAG: hypothetical protein WAK96_04440, partial [Desulfobaccales bacterium]